MNFPATFNLSNATENRLNQREKDENTFEKNREVFSHKISESIFKEVILKSEKTFNDSYLTEPSNAVPLSIRFSFEIVNPKDAIALIELALDSAELSPFKEWFERFSLQNQKINKEIDCFQSSSILSKNVNGIDREYFQEMMALVGRSVQIQLKKSFQDLTSLPENSCLKVEVKWYRKAEQLLSVPSDFRDNSLVVTIWKEQLETQQLRTITSIGSSALMKEREVRRKTQFQRQILYVTGAIALFALILFVISPGLQIKIKSPI